MIHYITVLSKIIFNFCVVIRLGIIKLLKKKNNNLIIWFFI